MVVTTRAYLLPLKPFADAKSRLRHVTNLDVDALSRRLALGVIDELRGEHLSIVADDPRVSAWALEQGLNVIDAPTPGLNPAVQFAYASVTDVDVVVVVHGDLQRPEGLATFTPATGVTIVSDHHGTGTNVLALPTGTNFRFQYGPGSRGAHAREAERLGLALTTITDSPWAYDVDEPSDL